MESEQKIITTLQSICGANKDNCSMTQFMNLISIPFHVKIYSTIILLLFLTKKINSDQLFIIILSQFIIFGIKYAIKRRRPFQSNPNIKILEKMDFDPYSFPSGHTMNVFLLYYILKKNNVIDLGMFPYLVALSRVYMGVHYPSDVLGGMLLAKIILKVF